MTPFQCLYGREPPLLLWFEKESTPFSMAERQLLERDQMLDELKQQLMQAQPHMKRTADAKRRDIQFNVGD